MIMKVFESEIYEAPVVELVEVNVEKGFEGSITPPGVGGGEL
jgi:hypothetical protein